jgi:hypothetical protein
MSPASSYLRTIAQAREIGKAGCMYRGKLDYHQFDIMGDRGHVVYSCELPGPHIYVGQIKHFHDRISEHLAAGWNLRRWMVLASNLTRRQAESLEPVFAELYRRARFLRVLKIGMLGLA